ncbi:MAG: ABC transporter ATP-binding protein [Methylocystaceae bacterium]|nr:ABC transporter ATP-binding protein [Methylocystaceae bacterium]
MSTLLLEVEGLSTHFMTANGILKAVDNVSFTLDEGEIVGLVGESGSGKSVTGFSLLGLVDPPGRIVAGSVRLQGRELIGLPNADLRKIRGREISMVFQDPSTTLNPVLSVGEQMRLALAAHENISRKAADIRCIAVLNQVGIPDATSRLEHFPHQFSGGMRQRVAIAIALLNRPKLIICDEPTTALDVSIQAQILLQMKSLAKDFGTALVWISHDLSTVSSLASKLLVMYAGRLIEMGPTRDVLRNPRHPYTQGLLNSLPDHAQQGQPLAQIKGQMPSLIGLDEKCGFLSRCEKTGPLCQLAPPWTAQEKRFVRCHYPLHGANL